MRVVEKECETHLIHGAHRISLAHSAKTQGPLRGLLRHEETISLEESTLVHSSCRSGWGGGGGGRGGEELICLSESQKQRIKVSSQESDKQAALWFYNLDLLIFFLQESYYISISVYKIPKSETLKSSTRTFRELTKCDIQIRIFQLIPMFGMGPTKPNSVALCEHKLCNPLQVKSQFLVHISKCNNVINSSAWHMF